MGHPNSPRHDRTILAQSHIACPRTRLPARRPVYPVCLELEGQVAGAAPPTGPYTTAHCRQHLFRTEDEGLGGLPRHVPNVW